MRLTARDIVVRVRGIFNVIKICLEFHARFDIIFFISIHGNGIKIYSQIDNYPFRFKTNKTYLRVGIQLYQCVIFNKYRKHFPCFYMLLSAKIYSVCATKYSISFLLAKTKVQPCLNYIAFFSLTSHKLCLKWST